MPNFHEKLKDYIPHAAPANSISMFGYRPSKPEHEFTIDTYKELYGESAYQACLQAELFKPGVITSMHDS